MCWFCSKEEKKLNFAICFTNLWRKEIRKNVSILPIKCLCIVCNILLENYFHVCLGNSFQRWSLSVPSDGWKSPSVTLLAVKCTVSEKNTDSVMNNMYVVCYSPTFTFKLKAFKRHERGEWFERRRMLSWIHHQKQHMDKPKWCK